MIDLRRRSNQSNQTGPHLSVFVVGHSGAIPFSAVALPVNALRKRSPSGGQAMDSYAVRRIGAKN